MDKLKMKKYLLMLLLFTAFSVVVRAQTEEKRIERLSDLAKVWGAVKYFHPFPAYREIDWDKALVETIPKVNAAKSSEEYAAAVNAMLAVLGDTQTRAFVKMESAPNGDKKTAAETGKEPLRLENGVLFYDALEAARASSQNNEKSREFQQNFFKFFPQAKSLVIDARAEGETDDYLLYSFGDQLRQMLSVSLDKKVMLSTIRYRMYNGYAPQDGTTSGGYYSGLITDTPENLGSDETKSFKTPPMVIIVDADSPNNNIFSGLQTAGNALIVAETDDLGVELNEIKIAGGVSVKMRTMEIVQPDGAIGFTPDVVAPKGEAAQTAQKIVAENKFVSNRMKTSAANIAQISQKDKTYAEMQFPAKEYRLLALFRFWNVINYFYPYKNLTGSNWASILPKYIPQFEADNTAAEYEFTVREMVTEIHDSHGGVQNANASTQIIGNFTPPVVVRFVENQTVIVKVLDDKLPVKAGDVVLTIDGETAEKRRDFLARYFAASTPQALMRSVHYNLLRGQKDSTAKLTVRGADGAVRTVELPRSLDRTDRRISDADNRTTPVFTVLPSGFGYVDLDRLQNGEVDKMFETIKDAPAVIFDMRGYPNGTAWSIAPRLTEKNQPVAAFFDNPLLEAKNVSNSDYSNGANFTFGQPIPRRDKGDVYKGKIVMLIDEYAISQAEHTCLFFESARPDITFIGTPTTGANGDVTNLILPGNIRISFSGHSVRHADGRQLQRIGIQPTVKAAPSIRGIVEGKDEILDAAIKFLQGNKK